MKNQLTHQVRLLAILSLVAVALGLGIPQSARAQFVWLSASPSSLNFGNQQVGVTSAAQTVTVTNNNEVEIILGGLTASGEFGLSNDTCSMQTLPAFSTCAFDVAFHPLSAGAKIGTVSIPSELDEVSASVSLTGNGIALSALRFRSNGANDGTVRESNETSGVGEMVEPVTELISVGDDFTKRQLVGIVDFDTSSLPNNAVITSARLQVKVMALTNGLHNGVYAALGDLRAVVANPHFGASPSLHRTDFQARSLADAGVFTRTNTYNRWIYMNMLPNSLFAVNLTGRTQFRLHFTLDDSNDGIKQEIRFLSGDYQLTKDQPTLIVMYYVP